MFDTMKVTKIVGGLTSALLVFLFANWAANSLYGFGEKRGEGEEKMAYVIETEEDGGGAQETAVEEGPDFATLLASADPEKGAKLFKKCAACHAITPGTNRTGPTLYGVVGRDIGSVEGFGYSATLAEMEGNWDPEALNGFLENPKGYAPGTKMAFKGFKKVEERADIIAYLQTLSE